MLAYCRRLEAERDALGYDADGVVVKVDDLEQQRRLGATAHHPRWAIAFKFAARQATTRVLGITINVGKTGALTPAAQLEPVELAGVTVSNVSLHNEDEVRRKDVRVGDTVLIERAGDVIPYLVQVVTAKRPAGRRAVRMPDHCPVCGGVACRAEGEAIWRCTNTACPAQLKERLFHFGLAAGHGHRAPGRGRRSASSWTAGWCEDFADLYALDVDAARRARAPGREVGAEPASRPSRPRRRAGSRACSTRLGIRMVGERAAQLLAARFGTMERLLAATEADINEIHGIGPQIAAVGRALLRRAAQPGDHRAARPRRASS